MNASIFLARIIGPIYLLVGIGFLLNRSYYQDAIKRMLDEPAVTYIGGVMSTLVGILILRFHHIWSFHWSVFITLLGYIAIAKGVSLLVFPEHSLNFSRSLIASDFYVKYVPPFAITLGVIFVVFGYRLI